MPKRQPRKFRAVEMPNFARRRAVVAGAVTRTLKRCQFQTETLERRVLFSVIVVNDATDRLDNPADVTVSTLGTNITLRDAIDAANNTPGCDPTINFASSITASGPATIDLSIDGDDTFGPSALPVTGSATIDGPTGADGITLANATPTDNLRLFYVASGGNLTLENLTLSGGLAQGGNSQSGGGGAGLGGAIVNAGSLTLQNDTLTANQAIGGMDISNGSSGGGGLGGDGSGDSGGGPNSGGGFGGGGDSESNGGFGGGGGGSDSSTPGAGGFGGGGGGAVDSGGEGGFAGGNGDTNQDDGGGAGLGGAVFNFGGTVLVINSTLADNSAIGGTATSGFGATNGSGLGGALFNLNGSVTVTNGTFANNIAAQGGGAIYSLGDDGIATQSGPALPSTTATVTLNNTILAGSNDGAMTPNLVSDYLQNTNDSGDGGGPGAVSSSGSNNIIQTTAASGNFAGSALNSDPDLGPLFSNGGPTQTLALPTDSPAIDAGSEALAVDGQDNPLTTDQRGFPRIEDDTVDIGAYEAAAATTTSITSDPTNPEVGQSVTLTATVAPELTQAPDAANPTGNVTFTVDPGQETLNLNGFNPGDQFTLSFDGGATNTLAISYDPNASNEAADIQDALPAILGGGDTATVAPASTSGYYTITFGGGLAGQNPALSGAAVAPATGTVAVVQSVFPDNTLNGSSQASLVLPSLLQGTYTIAASYSGDTYYAPSCTSITLTNPLAPTVTVTDVGGVYNGSPYPASGSVTGVDNADLGTPTFTYYVENNLGSLTLLDGAPTSAGNYVVVASFAANGSYGPGSSQASFTIGFATPTVAVSDSGGVFNGSPYPATGSVTGVDEDLGTPTFTYYVAGGLVALKGAPTNVGYYVVVASIASGGNYTAASNNASFSITQATPTVNVSDAGGVYKGSSYSATGSVTGVSSANLGKPTFAYYLSSDKTFSNPLAGAPTTVGSYVVVASYAASTDYAAASNNVSFSITVATPEVSVSDAGGVYSSAAFGATATVAGVGLSAVFTPTLEGMSPALTYYSGLTATGTPLSGAPANVGHYTVVASFPGSTDYATASNSTAFSITIALPTIHASDPSGVYNGKAFPATGSVVTASGASVATPIFTYYLASDTTFSHPLSGAPTTPGSYSFLATFNGNSNCLPTTSEGVFSITTAATVIHASDLGGAYNGKSYAATGYVAGPTGASVATPVFTYYLASDKTFSHPLSAAPSAPGSYVFIATYAGNGGYLATKTSGAFSITIPVTSFTAVAVKFTAGTTFSGEVATFSAPAGLAASLFTATITWGDGTTSTGTVIAGSKSGTFEITGSHKWTKAGTYTITITLTPTATTALTAKGSAT